MNDSREDRLARMIELYEGRLETYGLSHQTVGWGTSKDQFLRFRVLCRNIELVGKRVLDIGCGLGHLAAFLEQETDDRFEYVGIDASPKLIEAARQAHGGPRRQFLTMDIGAGMQHPVSKEPLKGNVAICSGTLTYETGDNDLRARELIPMIFERVDEVLAINFMSTFVDFRDNKNHHFDPGAMLNFCRSVAPFVSLFHDYPLYEFSIQLRHNPLT